MRFLFVYDIKNLWRIQSLPVKRPLGKVLLRRNSSENNLVGRNFLETNLLGRNLTEKNLLGRNNQFLFNLKNKKKKFLDKKFDKADLLGRKRTGEEGVRNEETGKKVFQVRKARGLLPSKDHILGNSEEEEKELKIKEKAVRKRKVEGQGIDGTNRRLGKVSKLGQGHF